MFLQLVFFVTMDKKLTTISSSSVNTLRLSGSLSQAQSVPTPPSDLHSAAAWILHGARHSQAQATTLLKLFLQSTIYLIWRERNARRHQQAWTTTDQRRRRIDRAVRNRILSLCYRFDHKLGGLMQRWFLHTM